MRVGKREIVSYNILEIPRNPFSRLLIFYAEKLIGISQHLIF